MESPHNNDEFQFAESIRDQLIKQLSAVNEQLEQFAYVASHDLREPLRIIVSFTDLLAKEYGAKLDEDGWQYMAIIRQAAKKMEAMVADLLEYGRLGQTAERFTETNCDDVLQRALEALSESITSTKAQVRSDPLPIVVANPIRFSRLFQNLIGNALKYQKPETMPIIAIKVQCAGDFWQFSVADNGLGIDKDYFESIFTPFKRLHSDQEYFGTGLGLAICKRIVESFGGTLWVNSTIGKGSIFYFTIPKIKEAA